MPNPTSCKILIRATGRSTEHLEPHLRPLATRLGGQLQQSDADLWLLMAGTQPWNEQETGRVLGELLFSGLVSSLHFAA